MNNYVASMRTLIGNKPLIIAGAGVFVYRDGKVLLQKRRDNGLWSSHGGCIEIGESLEDAARRELFEETGLTANHLEPLGIFTGEEMLYTYPNGDEVYIIGTYYLCNDFSGELNPDATEVNELRWFDLDALPTEISDPDRTPFEAFVEAVRRKTAPRWIYRALDPQRDMDYAIECHCRVNYECDCEWARIPYPEYRERWLNMSAQVAEFMRALRDSLSDPHSMVCIVERPSGKRCGYVLARAIDDTENGYSYVDLQDIYVEEGCRNLGAAREWMTELESRARSHGAKMIRSGTGSVNKKSIRLHESMGYTPYRYEYEKLLE